MMGFEDKECIQNFYGEDHEENKGVYIYIYIYMDIYIFFSHFAAMKQGFSAF
jgi:hypothetical protein